MKLLNVLHLERYVSKGLSGASDCGGGRKARAQKADAADPAGRPTSPDKVSEDMLREEEDGQ